MSLLKRNGLIHETKLATLISEEEGGVKPMSIAQIKEVQRVLLGILANHPEITEKRLAELLKRHKKPK